MMNGKIIVLVTCYECEKTVFDTLLSIEKQMFKDYVVLLSEDKSNKLQKNNEFKYLSKYMPVVYFQNNFENVIKNRNFLLKTAKRFRNNSILVRCDSDDVFNNEYVFRDIYKNFETFSSIRKSCEIMLGSNCQISKFFKRVNSAKFYLKNKNYLLDRLYYMKLGYTEMELPSSNLVWKNFYNFYYPNIRSGEDHLLLTNILLNYRKSSDFRVDEDLIMINYNLNGFTTNNNKKHKIFFKTREKLFDYVRGEYENKKL